MHMVCFQLSPVYFIPVRSKIKIQYTKVNVKWPKLFQLLQLCVYVEPQGLGKLDLSAFILVFHGVFFPFSDCKTFCLFFFFVLLFFPQKPPWGPVYTWVIGSQLHSSKYRSKCIQDVINASCILSVVCTLQWEAACSACILCIYESMCSFVHQLSTANSSIDAPHNAFGACLAIYHSSCNSKCEHQTLSGYFSL